MNENLKDNQSNSPNSFQEIIKNIDENPKNSKKNFIKFAVVLILIILLFGGSVLIYQNYFSPEAQIAKEQKQNYEQYLKLKDNYDRALKEDTYGGKTPKETLQLFIDALKKEDIDLAVKYFVINFNGEPDQKWKTMLQRIKTDGNLKKMSEDLIKYNIAKKTFDNYYIFGYYNSDGSMGLQITMKLIEPANIWKIESIN